MKKIIIALILTITTVSVKAQWGWEESQVPKEYVYAHIADAGWDGCRLGGISFPSSNIVVLNDCGFGMYAREYQGSTSLFFDKGGANVFIEDRYREGIRMVDMEVAITSYSWSGGGKPTKIYKIKVSLPEKPFPWK